jgi:hypothetical protein
MGCLLYQIQNEELVVRFSFDGENRRSVRYSNDKAVGEDVSRIPLLFKNKHNVSMSLCTEVPIMR